MPQSIAQPASRTDETTRFVSAVFASWKAAKLEFLVLRNYEGLPEFTTNDIDVLVAPKALASAESILRATARAQGFRLHNRAEFATLACYFSSETSTSQVHFDLFTALKWRAFDFLRCDDFLRERVAYKEFFVPRAGHEAATNLLATMIYTGKVKEKYKDSITRGFESDEGAARAVLASTYGAKLADEVLAAGRAADWAGLERLTAELRRALSTRQVFGAPLLTIGSVVNDARRVLGRLLKPPGMVVVMCGPDGSGKSTVSKLLQEGLRPSFSAAKGRQYHWKIPVVSGQRLAERKPTDDPHGKPPRNRLLSLMYFAVHWFEFVLGPRIALLPTLFRGGLVLIDRYYYDFFADPMRYRLNLPRWVVRAGYVFIKKPHLVLFLDAPAEALQKRKQEVPLHETQRQREEFLKLARRLPQAKILDATQPAALVAEEAQRTVLNFLAERMRQRVPGVGVPQAQPPDNQVKARA